MQSQTNTLQEFVEASKLKGASDEFLATLLTRRGWPVEDVYTALGKYWEQLTGLAVPQRSGTGESSRDAFLYLLSFSMLATWSGAFGSILFQIIDYWFPDPVSVNMAFNFRQSVTWQMATVVVAFPIYLAVMRTIVRETAVHPERLQSGVRKWLTYIALLGTAGAMICDLIWFLDYFLTGELSTRFVLKASTVLIICGAIFFYYLNDLRSSRPAVSLRFGIGATAAVAAALFAGLSIAGLPSQQRAMEADLKRVQDLRNVAMAVNNFHTRTHDLPAALTELRPYVSRLEDPETLLPYAYQVLSADRYQVCANFATSNQELKNRTDYGWAPFWRHAQGHTCFALNAAEPLP